MNDTKISQLGYNFSSIITQWIYPFSVCVTYTWSGIAMFSTLLHVASRRW